MKIEDSGFYVRLVSDHGFILVCIDARRHRDGTTTWMVRKPGEDAELSVHAKKRDAMDAAMAYLATRKLKGEIK